MTKVLVASTLPAYVCVNGNDQAWLDHMEPWSAQGVEFFAALQVGQGKDHMLEPVEKLLASVGATVWKFSIDDGADQITMATRLTGQTTGRNMALEYIQRRHDITHILYLDADVAPPADSLEKLLEVDHPIVAGHIPGLCLNGPRLQVTTNPQGWVLSREDLRSVIGVEGEGDLGDLVHILNQREHMRGEFHPLDAGQGQPPFPPGIDVREHWSGAGFLMFRRDAAMRMRWGWGADDGCTDDSWTQNLAERLGLGKTWCRHDVVADHPPFIPSEQRPGYKLDIVR